MLTTRTDLTATQWVVQSEVVRVRVQTEPGHLGHKPRHGQGLGVPLRLRLQLSQDNFGLSVQVELPLHQTRQQGVLREVRCCQHT